MVLFSSILSVGGVKLTTEEVKNSMKETHLGESHHAIIEAVIPIILALGLVITICLLLVITSLTIPFVTAFIFIPFMLFVMLFTGIIFILRYFAVVLPFIHPGFQ
jgi:Zn-dependent protease with chaperone function